jgi:ribosomal protein S18 acetylase RimI-like enzyme
MIIKASILDLEEIYSLTNRCAKDLIKKAIFQWSELYPSKEILQQDLEFQQLWKFEENGILIGVIVLTEIEDKEYLDVSWLTKNKKNLYVHRLAVDPKQQGKGYAKQMMDFTENYAEENGYSSVRLDTFSENKRNQRFYEARNYKKLDNIFFPNQSELPFYCYEKIINKS